MSRNALGSLLCCGLVIIVWPVAGVELEQLTGAAHAYPAMVDLDGKHLANAEFTQEIKDDLLHVRISYDLKDDHRIEEKGIFQQRPALIQKAWSWREFRSETLQREYKVDFDSGQANARKREKEGVKEYTDQVEIEPGTTFAGFGFTLALENLRDRLVHGEALELKAVGFNPKPKVVRVKITHSGTDLVPMTGRLLRGEHFIIHPEIPAVAKLFVKVPDTHIWLTQPPSGFLRWEGPLAEPGETIVRVDLTGGESGRARPASKEPE